METKDFVLGYGAGKNSAVSEKIVEEVDAWLDEHITNPDSPPLDRSLTSSSAAAPADMVGDINDEVGDLKNTLSHKADLIYDTASGDIASFPDGADGLPVKDLTVGIEPVQAGTGDPSPTNIRPISGWTGCNVNRVGFNFTRSFTSGSSISRYAACLYAKADLLPSTQYCISFNDAVGHIIYNNEMLFTSSSAITTVAGRNYMVVTTKSDISKSDTNIYNRSYGWILMKNQNGNTVVPKFSDVCINLSDPSKDGMYEPYLGTTLPISWQSSAGTVYAASLDALAGSLKVRPYYASYNGETLVGPWISSMDAYTPGGTPTTGAQVVDFGGSETLYSLDSIAINTLLGQNNIFADCGPSTVEYPCDTKLYIQKINAPSDDDMIADAQIESGKYFIVNNNLYLSTTTILAGDPIKPGTNCTATNLAAALNALNS